MSAVGKHPIEYWAYVPHASKKRAADGTGTIYGPFTSEAAGQSFVGKQTAGSFLMGPFRNKQRRIRRKATKMRVVRKEPGEKRKEEEEIQDKIAFWLKELEIPAKQLTAWELNFVESVAEQFADRGTLTTKQQEVLAKIYESRTAADCEGGKVDGE